MVAHIPLRILKAALVLCAFLLAALPCSAQEKNEVMGEVQFIGASKAEKTSGVWVDGQYVGYLAELKGTKKVMLLPGEHEIAVRQSAYKDFIQKIVVEPGKRTTLHVTMERDLSFQYPAVYSEIKLRVMPNRGAVFVDDRFVGHVHEFGGVGRKMQVSPGKHRIKIALPGYQTFETEVNLLPKQRFTIKTELVKGSITQASPLIKQP